MLVVNRDRYALQRVLHFTSHTQQLQYRPNPPLEVLVSLQGLHE